MITPPFELLADDFRYGTGEWHYSQFEGLGAAHPLIKSGILAARRQSAYYNCPRTCCDDPQREVIEEDGSFLAMCPYSGEPMRLTREELTVWEYDPERTCRLLQELLSCAALRPFDENTWCLGQSALPDLAGRLVFVQTKADEASLCRALASTPNAPYILLTGRADTLSPASSARPQTFTFASTLTLDARGTLALTPLAFASLPPLQTQTKSLAEDISLILEGINALGHKANVINKKADTIDKKVSGDYESESPNLRSRTNSRLIELAVNKYWELINKGFPARDALTPACRAVVKEHGLAEYKTLDSFKNSVRREINKNSHALMEHPETT